MNSSNDIPNEKPRESNTWATRLLYSPRTTPQPVKAVKVGPYKSRASLRFDIEEAQDLVVKLKRKGVSPISMGPTMCTR